MTRPALVYGATGFTGRLVARALIDREIDVVLSGRDRSRLTALAADLGGDIDVRPAVVHNPATLKNALAGTGVVVNCAGPFTLLGEPVVRAAIEFGVHYLDTTGEQRFMRDIYERYDSAARHAGVAVVNSFAFEVALGDWAAALAARRLGGDDPLEELLVAYAVSGFAATRGTQLSALESMTEEGCVWARDRWEPIAPAAEVRTFSFPAGVGERQTMSFPSGEVITVPRHVAAGRVQAYISLAADTPARRLGTRLTSLVGPALPTLLKSPLSAYARGRISRSAEGPDAGARDRATFAVLADARRRFEQARVVVTGADPYGLTAEIMAFGVASLLSREPGDGPAAGVLAPSEAFEPERSLAEVAERSRLEVWV